VGEQLIPDEDEVAICQKFAGLEWSKKDYSTVGLLQMEKFH